MKSRKREKLTVDGNVFEIAQKGSLANFQISSVVTKYPDAFGEDAGTAFLGLPDDIKATLFSYAFDGKHISVTTAGETRMLSEEIADELFANSASSMVAVIVASLSLNLAGFLGGAPDPEVGGQKAKS